MPDEDAFTPDARISEASISPVPEVEYSAVSQVPLSSISPVPLLVAVTWPDTFPVKLMSPVPDEAIVRSFACTDAISISPVPAERASKMSA